MATKTRSDLSDHDFIELLVHVLDTFARTAEEKSFHFLGTDLRAFLGRCEILFQSDRPGKPTTSVSTEQAVYPN
jgi:hypothetical protein